MGRVVYRQAISLVTGGNPLALPTLPLTPGLYLARLHRGGFVQQAQFVQQ